LFLAAYLPQAALLVLPATAAKAIRWLRSRISKIQEEPPGGDRTNPPAKREGLRAGMHHVQTREPQVRER
jgi:hypothetical protein